MGLRNLQKKVAFEASPLGASDFPYRRGKPRPYRAGGLTAHRQ